MASSPIREMALEDPFSGVDPILSGDAEVEKKVDDGGHESPEVEEGLDAAEMSITPEELSSEEVQSTIVTPERSFINTGHPLASAVPLPPPQVKSVHYGKFRGTRRTFILVAKISTFVDILGLFDQVEMVLDIYFTPIFLEKGFRSHQEIL